MSNAASKKTLLTEGVVVGLAGAAVVAIWFLLVDLMSGTVLQTPGALGSALFLGARSPEAVEISWVTVGLYTLVHGIGFALIGLMAAGLVRAADRSPSLLAGIFQLVILLEVFFVGGVAIVAEFLLGFLAWWAVLGGNLLASIVMAAILLRWHPLTAARLRHTDRPIPTP